MTLLPSDFYETSSFIIGHRNLLDIITKGHESCMQVKEAKIKKYLKLVGLNKNNVNFQRYSNTFEETRFQFCKCKAGRKIGNYACNKI
jgi:hypothetical protein